ncbi:hypothetical protein Tsp_01147 [Trichinella spiralis]|uniref:hypothetical protein n=1 Tax=Trichinella spiralis TaxID=6334 RepID=UPI0001EFC467|nr:hypothetical protein Tsp_01147 [Trichinella spiralis]
MRTYYFKRASSTTLTMNSNLRTNQTIVSSLIRQISCHLVQQGFRTVKQNSSVNCLQPPVGIVSLAVVQYYFSAKCCSVYQRYHLFTDLEQFERASKTIEKPALKTIKKFLFILTSTEHTLTIDAALIRILTIFLFLFAFEKPQQRVPVCQY